MNGVNHAVTALMIKKFWPGVPIVPILVSVQLIDILWAVLNIIDIENTRFESNVSSLADIHFVHMPFSHSIFFTLVWAGIAWIMVVKVFKKPSWWGLPIFIGVMSHVVLDIATHMKDIEIIPFIGLMKIGTGAYSVPLVALVIELLYCGLCWRIFKGNYFTLACLIAANLLGITFYVPQIIGPESWLASHPYLFAPIVGFQLVIASVIVWWLYNREQKSR